MPLWFRLVFFCFFSIFFFSFLFLPPFWFPQDNLRTPKPIDIKVSGMIGHGMRKNPIDFGGGHLGFGAAILDLVKK